MATVAAVATVIGAVAGVGAAVQQRRQGKKIAAEQRRQGRVRNRLERLRQGREIRRRIAQQRVQRAAIEQAGFQFGVAGSSSAQQAAGATTTDLAGTIGFGQQQLSSASTIAQSQNRISGIQGQFNPFGAIQSVAGVFASPQVNSVFGDLFGS